MRAMLMLPCRYLCRHYAAAADAALMPLFAIYFFSFSPAIDIYFIGMPDYA